MAVPPEGGGQVREGFGERPAPFVDQPAGILGGPQDVCGGRAVPFVVVAVVIIPIGDVRQRKQQRALGIVAIQPLVFHGDGNDALPAGHFGDGSVHGDVAVDAVDIVHLPAVFGVHGDAGHAHAVVGVVEIHPGGIGADVAAILRRPEDAVVAHGQQASGGVDEGEGAVPALRLHRGPTAVEGAQAGVVAVEGPLSPGVDVDVGTLAVQHHTPVAEALRVQGPGRAPGVVVGQVGVDPGEAVVPAQADVPTLAVGDEDLQRPVGEYAPVPRHHSGTHLAVLMALEDQPVGVGVIVQVREGVIGHRPAGGVHQEHAVVQQVGVVIGAQRVFAARRGVQAAILPEAGGRQAPDLRVGPGVAERLPVRRQQQGVGVVAVDPVGVLDDIRRGHCPLAQQRQRQQDDKYTIHSSFLSGDHINPRNAAVSRTSASARSTVSSSAKMRTRGSVPLKRMMTHAPSK